MNVSSCLGVGSCVLLLLNRGATSLSSLSTVKTREGERERGRVRSKPWKMKADLPKYGRKQEHNTTEGILHNSWWNEEKAEIDRWNGEQ